MGHEETHAPRQIAKLLGSVLLGHYQLLDQRVGAGVERRRHVEAERRRHASTTSLESLGRWHGRVGASSQRGHRRS